MNKFSYLIIGNSAAAIGAVESIRTVDGTGTIGIVSEESHHAYSRPKISESITKGSGVKSIAYRPEDFYEKHSVTPILGAKAIALDTAGKTIQLENGEKIGYDKLLLSTGANPSHPPILGIDLPGVHFFTTYGHAEGLANNLSKIERVVIIGGGLIGLQAAEALVKAGKTVTVVEMLNRLLGLVVDEHASALIQEKFAENGVTVLTSTRVFGIDSDGADGIARVVLGDGTTLPCDAVVVAAGVTPRTELAGSAGIEVRRGIPVNDFMQTSDPDVYAAGDVAETKDLLSGECRLTPIWPNAYMEGRIAGLSMASKPEPYTGGLSMNAAHFFDFPVISAGTTDKAGDCTEILDSNERTGFYRRIILKNNVPIGMCMAGDAVDRSGLILSLIRNRTDVSQFIDQITESTFNAAHLPEELRRVKQQGREKV